MRWPFRNRAADRKVAFVLSGGGNLGAVQVGMIRALVEHGIKPDVIVGCSVGAINGAAFAAEPNLRGVQRMEALWAKLAAGNPDVMPNKRLVPVPVQLSRKGTSIYAPEPMENLLRSELPAGTFSDLAVPFACVATDTLTASQHWFHKGPLVPALMASAALPAVYPAVEIEGKTYYDGGVVTELPVHWAVESGATDFYVLQVGHLDPRPLEVDRPFDSLMHAYWSARIRRFEDDLAELRTHHTVIRLPAGSASSPRIRFDDWTRGEELMHESYTASTSYLSTGQSMDPTIGPVSVGV